MKYNKGKYNFGEREYNVDCCIKIGRPTIGRGLVKISSYLGMLKNSPKESSIRIQRRMNSKI